MQPPEVLRAAGGRPSRSSCQPKSGVWHVECAKSSGNKHPAATYGTFHIYPSKASGETDGDSLHDGDNWVTDPGTNRYECSCRCEMDSSMGDEVGGNNWQQVGSGRPTIA